MYIGIETTGYKNLLLMYDIKTSGLHEYPHGSCDGCSSDDNTQTRPDSREATLPYHRCEAPAPDALTDCVDYNLTEEMFSILYTTDSILTRIIHPPAIPSQSRYR